MTADTLVQIEQRLSGAAAAHSLAADVLTGLTRKPKTLPPKWLYDATGSDLFEQITRLPEYYPTRREREVLTARAAAIAERVGAETLIELGSGSSKKTRVLLDALGQRGTLRRYVPVDVSEVALGAAARAVVMDYPQLRVNGVVADFETHLDSLPRGPRRLVAFLGGTIGNFEPGPRSRFLTQVASTLRPGDAFLLGTDLVKDVDRLLAAYDDAAGVTALFDLNVLSVLNRELGADFDLTAFTHEARWSARDSWIEMHLRALCAQTVKVGALGLDVVFERGETVRTEVSAKFTRTQLEREYRDAGLRMDAWWTDAAGDYAVSLAVPA
jgi:L-histidine Nalpha-methyltransferase